MFKIREIITISDYVTLINIVLGLMAILLNDFAFVYVAVVFDALDGMVARKTNTVSDFGAELDSICDVVSFGVAPAYLLYANIGILSPGLNMWGALLASVFICCGALRLARFGVLDVKGFIGLPIPAGALFVCSILHASLIYNGAITGVLGYVVLFVYLIAGLLMICDIRYPKYPRKAYLVAFSLAILIGVLGQPIPLVLCLIFYTIYGVYGTLTHEL
ncbi:CDP-diacylglycerol--serine O-phosphatidyltransferase [Methanococcus voltae]|uniref:CDP-diacylglycerol--serine O-phosphatidyltransferase n=1 Tax=Methanococcus voltae (strain ATCC BAA-1334 / A3) TaxID=456320 RepID=D7DU07_METV3|nr:CDP-diacylglycerol--serine O-phosphatidyltransferase [Methanococcus voltae]MCS3900417.1 CDP-diacylglycerol--serine O-phosphatidyltransferase [Methanococcus voltae]